LWLLGKDGSVCRSMDLPGQPFEASITEFDGEELRATVCETDGNIGIAICRAIVALKKVQTT
jgi:hypothetical protein